jgi:hypothetical protein
MSQTHRHAAKAVVDVRLKKLRNGAWGARTRKVFIREPAVSGFWVVLIVGGAKTKKL